MKIVRLTGWILALTIVAGASFWAGRVTLAEPEDISHVPADTTTVEVRAGDIGQSLTLAATLRRPSVPLVANSRAGTLTSLCEPGEFGPGDEVYRVDNHPVRILASPIPFYRTLSVRAKGDDVRAVNSLLAELGYGTDPESDTFTDATRRGVVAWQADLGIEQTGVLEADELIAVDSLPMNLSCETDVRTGDRLSGGEQIVEGKSAIPEFSMELTQQQAELIPPGATMMVVHEGSSWPAVVVNMTENDRGLLDLELQSPDGRDVCGDDCASIDPTVSSMLVEIEVVPDVSGSLVPVASLSQRADGTVVVTDADTSQEIPVTVLGTQDGLSVVEGVEPGRVIKLFGETHE